MRARLQSWWVLEQVLYEQCTTLYPSSESLATQDYSWAMRDCAIPISYNLIVTIERYEKKLLPRQIVDCTVDQEAADGYPLEGVWKYLYSTRLIIYDPSVQMTTLTLLLQPLILNTIADELVYKKITIIPGVYCTTYICNSTIC